MTLNAEIRQELIAAAVAARPWAYAPYSKFLVGAALLTESGKIYDGINAAYPSGICAERVAVFKAVSEGERKFVALAVSTSNAGSSCGACRQVLAEWGLDTIVLFCDAEGNVVTETTVGGMLPGAFLPEHLLG
jgi:cytidine deaminase